MRIVLSKTDAKGDKKLSLFICTYVMASAFNIAIKTIFNIPQAIWPRISFLFEGIILISLLLAIPTLLFRKGRQLIILESLFVFLYAMSILMGFVDLSLLKSTAFWTLAVCIPFGVAGVAVNEKLVLFKYLKVSSYIEYPILCAALLNMKNAGTYSMSVSYVLILPVLFFLYDYFENRKLYSLIFALIGSVLIIIYGARGPVVCILFYAVVKLFLFNDREKGLRSIIIRLAVMSLILLIFVNWNSIVGYIEEYLTTSGINSYALRRLINGQITETAGRGQLWQHYFGLLNERPLIGYGLLGGWISAGEGPHNMLLEFLLAFGYVIGGGACIYAIILLIKAIRQKDAYFAEGILILAAYNFTMYSVSGNWLEKPYFFLFAFLTMFSRKKKANENQSYIEEA